LENFFSAAVRNCLHRHFIQVLFEAT